jgi:pimeloyl-ACP methyl ester carboxylesterase
VHGDRDEFFPVTIPVEMYQAIPGAALWIVPRGGHVPIIGRRSAQFLDVALEFLRGAGVPPAR